MDSAIAVFGAGAVGLYVGGLLAAAGSDVTLIGRPHTVDPIAERGLSVRRLSGETTTGKPRICHDIGDLSGATFDLVILTVKAYDVDQAVPALTSLMGVAGIVLSMQNGVGSDHLLIDALGESRILAGTLTVSVGVEAPGEVTEFNSAGGIAVAAYGASDVPGWVHDLLARTPLPVLVLANPQSLKWSKLLLNMVGSAQSAILDIGLDVIAADRRLFAVERAAFREAVTALKKARIRIIDLPGYPVRRAALAMTLPITVSQRLLGRKLAGGRGGKSPTMRSDLARGRGKTEVDYLNGAVVQLGKSVGVPTPVNATLSETVRRLAKHPADRNEYRQNPGALLALLRAAGARL